MKSRRVKLAAFVVAALTLIPACSASSTVGLRPNRGGDSGRLDNGKVGPDSLEHIEQEAFTASGCGIERWGVKTGTDSTAGQVNLSSATPTSMASLVGLKPPNPIPSTTRVAPTETTLWKLDATLVEYKLESDSDYHLVLKDSAGHTMLAEIPLPSCVGAGSPFKAGITNARAQFDAKYHATTSFQSANIPVEVQGVGFFDFLHGQTGVAPNGVELHPVLNVTFNPTQTSDFTMTESPPTVSVSQGAQGTANVSTTVSGTFNSAVALSATGLPSGVSANFSPASIAAPGSGSSTLTFQVGGNATPGDYTVTLNGNGGGKAHSISLTLTIVSVRTPDFTLVVNPASVSVAPGASDTTVVATTVMNGFNSAVAVAALSLPNGVSASFSPSTIPAPGAGQSTLTLTASAAAAPGTYTVAVGGSGGGQSHNFMVGLTITGSGSSTIVDGGFESATASGMSAPGWTGVSNKTGVNIVIVGGPYAHSGSNYASLGGVTKLVDSLTQTVTIPTGITSAQLSFWTNITTQETTSSNRYDYLRVKILDGQGHVLATPLTLSNLDASKDGNTNGTYFQPPVINLTSYAGRTIEIQFASTNDYTMPTTFLIDDVSLATS
jgi:hypothetical protein